MQIRPQMQDELTQFWMLNFHNLVSCPPCSWIVELELITMYTRTTNACVRWGRTIKYAVGALFASVYQQQHLLFASQKRRIHIPHPTKIGGVVAVFHIQVLVGRLLWL